MAKQKSLRFALVIGWVVLGLFAVSGYAEQPPEEVWNQVFDSGYEDVARGVAVDKNGNVYVTGYSDNGTDNDYRTIKYAPDGSIQWNKVYNSSGDDYARGVAVDESGNVYVTGTFTYPRIRTWDCGGIRYDPNGNITGITTYDSGDDDFSAGVAVDKAGFVYVTGGSWNDTDWDCRTIKYDPYGNIVWNKVFDSGDEDIFCHVAVGQVGFAGYVYVTGRSWNGMNHDYQTIKYDLAGNIQWNEVYDGGSNDAAEGVAVDKTGNVYVTGGSTGTTNYTNYRTIKYAPDGSSQWNKVYDGGLVDMAMDVAVDKNGNVYVTGWSWNITGVDTNANYRTIKYRQSLSVKEHASIPNGFRFSLSPAFGKSVRIRYQLSNPCRVNLAVYDASGRKIATLINEKIQSGNYEYLWTPENTGIYFARLEAGDHQITKKFVCRR